ncbi:MAG: ATP-dependent DNA helicase PcrA [Candidatus Lloydbacteria bacterium CG22_combo_CG10-13_8_21_14_all_47_15]|uniref:DNA 3'-5' helicase n=1 Tax=Candidatus Lloydbacteria bacterium CG22_combo_CG10-13_8_21_14_all_47_15 TaxID=1974635 RepID=A0A2H0CU50_9BACT|nr:MAG: ATP-dependent DNA helicase PcrA [Candidatus Lloydbacteria bacterium CG22_combo_CG10-13_8_21_14_all_47_15]
MAHESELNEAQKKAVLHTEGPLLIIAGAGAGKTKTIVHRILYLIEQGVAPGAILAITFTNKAAREMRERVFLARAGARETESGPLVATFHALSVRILRESGRFVGVPKHFSIFDDTDSLAAVKTAIKEVGLDLKQFEPRRMKNAISRQKGDGVSLAVYQAEADNDYFPRQVARVWEVYDAALTKESALDFDDLLLKTHELLRDHREVRNTYHDRFMYIHIDEYQDTNVLQYNLSRLLAGERKNICVVGDLDQSIYSWRGADFRNILNFEKDYPDAPVVLLEENYRSTKTILAAANDVIKKNIERKEKNLYTNNKEGERIGLYEAFDEVDESRFIAEKIIELRDNGVKPDDIAILYRANFQSRALEEAMLSAHIPYQVLGVRFFERKEIKDILSYLRAAVNPQSITDLKRIINVPPRGIGKVSFAKIASGRADELPAKMRERFTALKTLLADIRARISEKQPSEAIRETVRLTGLEDTLKGGTDDERERLENIHELATLAVKYDALPPEEGIAALLSDAALASDQDSLDERTDKRNGVKLMTVHAAKGLEFEHVFVTGLEQDLFPHVNLGSPELDQAQREEERRLFYVALTRAKEKLHLSYAGLRTIFGSKQVNLPSEFLHDIDTAYLELEVPDAPPIERLKTIYFD